MDELGEEVSELHEAAKLFSAHVIFRLCCVLEHYTNL
jgi:hypothetical protein